MEGRGTTGKGRRAGAPRVKGGGQGHHGKGWRAGAPRVKGGGQGFTAMFVTGWVSKYMIKI